MAGYVAKGSKVLLKVMYEKAKDEVKLKLILALGAILIFGYFILTSKPLDTPPDNPPPVVTSASSADAPPPVTPPDTPVTPPDTPVTSASSADAQKPDILEAAYITLRCEDTTGITMVSVDTVKGTAKVGKAFYKDGDTGTRVNADGMFPPGCMVRDVVRVTDSTILIGRENVVGTCDAIKDSGTGWFAALDRLSGVVVVSLSIDDAKAGVGQKSLCRPAANGF